MEDRPITIKKYDLMNLLYRIGHYCFEEYLIDDDNSNGEVD